MMRGTCSCHFLLDDGEFHELDFDADEEEVDLSDDDIFQVVPATMSCQMIVIKVNIISTVEKAHYSSMNVLKEDEILRVFYVPHPVVGLLCVTCNLAEEQKEWFLLWFSCFKLANTRKPKFLNKSNC